MTGKIYLPHPPSNIIREICEVKADAQERILTHFVPPLGVPELVFYVGNRTQIKNVNIQDGFIKGQYETPQNIELNPDYHFIAVRLQPYGLKQLFGIDAHALNNAVIDAKEHALTAQIAVFLKGVKTPDSTTFQHIRQLIEHCPQQPISPYTQQFLKLLEANPDETSSINSLIQSQGINARSLQRHFKNEVGLSPKKFLRILRMNKIELALQQPNDWFQIIALFEFTDQSHLIKEFKSLRLHNPKDFIDKKLYLFGQFPPPEVKSI